MHVYIYIYIYMYMYMHKAFCPLGAEDGADAAGPEEDPPRPVNK